VRGSRFFKSIKEDAMLVLARKPGETIYIGNDIEITVMRVAGNNVKLAIKAPDGVKILRAELRKKEN
jgi:carbon storage regulator